MQIRPHNYRGGPKQTDITQEGRYADQTSYRGGPKQTDITQEGRYADQTS